MKIKPIAHGTPGGYRRHLERKVEMCEPCRDAMNVYRRAYREANPDKIAAKNYRGAARKRRLRDREAALTKAFNNWLRDELTGNTAGLVDSRDTLWTLWDLKFPTNSVNRALRAGEYRIEYLDLHEASAA